MKGKETLESASRILDQADHEADYRNAISRAYYGVFHIGQELRDALKLPIYTAGSGLGSHDALYDALFNCTNLNLSAGVRTSLKSFAFMLKDLKHHRVTADYKLDKTVTHANAQYAIGLAEKAAEKAAEIYSISLA
jgi:uncharacterized protein (UPF0332 family)